MLNKITRMKEITWNQAIEEAKQYLSLKNKNQMLIAELATNVCEIKRGGDLDQTNYTLTEFAKEIKVHYTTLQSWVTIYRKVFSKIRDRANTENLSYIQMFRIANSVHDKATKAEVNKATDDVMNLNTLDLKMKGYCELLRSIAYNFSNEHLSHRIKIETKEEVLFYCDKIQSLIFKVNPDIKPKDNDMAYLGSRTSVSRGLGSIHKSINVSDEKVYNHLKKLHPLYLSPTRIGKTIGNQNPDSQTSWALIRLKKLIKFGLCEKNDKGQYKAILSSDKKELAE